MDIDITGLALNEQEFVWKFYVKIDADLAARVAGTSFCCGAVGLLRNFFLFVALLICCEIYFCL